MAEKLEDLNLPNATVLKIIKDVLPENVSVGKDARSALSRAASIFVLYITSQATKEAQKANRKTLTAQDVTSALEELEFEDFVEPLQATLQEYKNHKPTKKKGKKEAAGDVGTVEEHDEEVLEDEEDAGD